MDFITNLLSKALFFELIFLIILLIGVNIYQFFYYRKKINQLTLSSNKQKSKFSSSTKKNLKITDPPLSLTGELSAEAFNTSNALSNLSNNVNNILMDWIVVGASVIGKSHIQMNLPCQDNYHYKPLKNGWGLAIISDGAGSAKHSDIGSHYAAKNAVEETFIKDFLEKDWYNNKAFPTDKEWKNFSVINFYKIRKKLEDYAKDHQYQPIDLACTLIVIFYHAQGILVSHIGDGRAGYKNIKGEWKPLITPWKGEEANSTIFITSNIWETEEVAKNYIGANVVRDEITAFTLMSDGCEDAAFEHSKMDSLTQKWVDPNQPHENFFNPLISSLKAMKQEKLSNYDIQQKWKKFLQEGNHVLKNEPDDKTMILGVLDI